MKSICKHIRYFAAIQVILLSSLLSIGASAQTTASQSKKTDFTWPRLNKRDSNLHVIRKLQIKIPKATSTASEEQFNASSYMEALSSDYVRNLSEALQYRTITNEDTSLASNMEMIEFQSFLEESFPLTFSTLSVEKVNKYSLLMQWKGTHPNLKPVLIIGHMDVVPVEGGTDSLWHYPPFGGTVTDSFIWGRGAIDDKVCVVGVLQSVETLLRNGFSPDRDIYLAFGNDEEVNGNGASAMADLLQSRNIHFESVLDEGGGIADGLIDEISGPLAFIGIGEKGYLTLQLSVRSDGGHSSFPKHETVLGILSQAVVNLETNQFPTRLTTPVRQMLHELGGKIGGMEGFAARHASLFSSILKKKLSDKPYTNSLVQTTTAVTMFEGGVAENVMPTHAKVIVNFRILPGETIKSVLHRVKRVIDDKRVIITEYPYANDPPKVSNIHSFSYKDLKKTIHQVYGDTLTITPALSISSSDSRHFDKIADNIYRFTPLWAKPGDVERLHGTNERIGISDYHKAIQFYCQYILNAGRKDPVIPLSRKQ